jgi:hypothetical protein
MALTHPDAITGSGKNPLRAPLRGYLARRRSALYFLSGAISAFGLALSWSWLTGDGLLPIVVFVPCLW